MVLDINYSQLLVYNIDINNEDVSHYLKYPEDFQFLTSLKHIETINLKSSISIFKDINSIYFIFYETPLVKSKHSTTKRITFSNNKNKTKRKRV